MHMPIEPQETSVQGWLSAAAAVQKRGGKAHNVIIDIADPLTETSTDAAIIREVDAFLRSRHVNTLTGVANTISRRAFSFDMARMRSTMFISIRCYPA